MLTEKQNNLVTRTGPGTPMGDVLRRYWIPALLSFELPGPDCAPVRLKLLGEDLIGFKDTSGQIGIVDAYCAHRRASLFWGRNEDGGLACVYHGWKYDVEGRCTEMPSEPDGDRLKSKIHITAYPAVERGGIVWVYMGPKGKKPAPPDYEWTRVPDSHRSTTKLVQDCNWLQCLEGGIDSVHATFLHKTFGGPAVGRTVFSPAMDKAIKTTKSAILDIHPTDYGYAYSSTRYMGENKNYIRSYHYIMPWHQLRPNQLNHNNTPMVDGHMWVPIDDEHTMVWNWSYTFGEAAFTEEEKHLHSQYGNALYTDIDVEDGFRPYVNRTTDYMIDREIQRTQTATGIPGINTQDRAIQETMGAIVNRKLEHLGTTDRAIITTRQLLIQATRTVAEGGDPPGVNSDLQGLRAIEKVLDSDVSWYDALKDELYGFSGVTGPRVR